MKPKLKPMKPTRMWAFVYPDGHIWVEQGWLPKTTRQDLIHTLYDKPQGTRIARVLITEVPK